MVGAYGSASAAGAPLGGAAYVFSPDVTPARADFSWDPVPAVKGGPVQFRDRSTGNPLTWSWDFGDGSGSTERDPIHTFPATGSYQVTLHVANSVAADTVSQAVQVVDSAPSAGFAWSPPSPAPGAMVQFRDASNGAPATWQWQFGDGSSSTEKDPSHVFPAAGVYDVVLTVANALGASSTTHSVTVQAGQSFAPDVVIPAVARLQGAGAFFTSRLDMFNSGSAPLEVAAVYTPRNDLGGSRWRSTVTVEPGLAVEVNDPLGAWFGFGDGDTAVGTLELAVSGGSADDLVVQSVVFARLADGSEYGQGLPALKPSEALQPGQTAYLSSTVDAGRNRVNVGVVALEDGTRVRVQPVNPLGAPLAAARELQLNAGVSTQINDLNNGSNGFGLGDAEDYVVEVATQAGAAFAYASVLDGNVHVSGTSDPTTILPVVDGAASATLVGLGTGARLQRVHRLGQRHQPRERGEHRAGRVLRPR